MSTENWARDNYQAAIDTVLPGGFLDDSPRNVEWIATVRILPTWDDEVAIRLIHTWQDKTEAEFVTARGRPIRAQLQLLKQQRPDAQLSAIVARLETESRKLSQADCSKLGDSARDLEVTKVAVIPPGLLMMDATSYEFWIQAAYGDRVHVKLTGPGPDAPKQPHELIAWVEKLRADCRLEVKRSQIK